MRGLPQKQNARRADKIRLCGHLRRYKKIVKKTYIIYTEIMKYVNNHEKLGDVFKISNRSYVNSLISDFILDCNKYSELMSDLEDEKKLGSESLRNIFTSIEFLNANPVKKSMFKLKPKNMTNPNSLKTHLIIENDRKIILKKDEILKYFNEIDKTLDFEFKEIVEEKALGRPVCDRPGDQENRREQTC